MNLCFYLLHFENIYFRWNHSDKQSNRKKILYRCVSVAHLTKLVFNYIGMRDINGKFKFFSLYLLTVIFLSPSHQSIHIMRSVKVIDCIYTIKIMIYIIIFEKFVANERQFLSAVEVNCMRQCLWHSIVNYYICWGRPEIFSLYKKWPAKLCYLTRK